MRLLLKATIIIGAAVTLGLVGIFSVAGVFVIEDYKVVEARTAELDAQQVRVLIQDDVDDLAWAARELSGVVGILFADNATAANSTESTALFISLFLANDIEAAFVSSPGGAIGVDWFGIGFTRATFEFIDPPTDLNVTLPGSSVMSPAGQGEPTGGIFDADGQLYLVASYPLGGIFGSEGSALAIARPIDAAYIASLSQRAKETVTVHTRGGDLLAEHPAWTTTDDVVIERLDWTHMSTYQPLTGVDGDRIGMLQVQQERTYFQEGINSMKFFFVSSLLISGLLLGVGLWFVGRYVTGRVDRLDRSMHRIAMDQADLSSRVEDGGDDEVGRLAQTFNHLMDVLERREADLNSFARVVTHDLKSPLSTFSLNLRLLRTQAEAAGDAKEIERIERMERTVASMGQRIQAILEYSRQTTAPLDLKGVPLRPVLDRVLHDLDGSIQTTGARLQVGQLPTVLGDADQLAQVFQNLLSNAFKFAKDGDVPHVRIWAENGRTGWAVHVEDRGVGFRPEDVTKMFTPFVRLDNATSKEGQGVGLSTCARIMQRLGGRLHAQGYPGKGARFTVLLRRVPRPTARSKQAAPVPAPQG